MRKSVVLSVSILLVACCALIWRISTTPVRRSVAQPAAGEPAVSPPSPVISLTSTPAAPLSLANSNSRQSAGKQFLWTNMIYTNGRILSGVVRTGINNYDHEAYMRWWYKQREEDRRLGTNQDVAQREAQLKEAAKALAVGMNITEIVHIMGIPDVVEVGVPTGDGIVSFRPVAFEDLEKYSMNRFDLHYNSWDSGAYNRKPFGHKPLPYENLLLRFQTNRELVSITWGR